jgi:hypothetical protein
MLSELIRLLGHAADWLGVQLGQLLAQAAVQWLASLPQ